jgi:oxygen-dependent protoporphyrinogen oxidase
LQPHFLEGRPVEAGPDQFLRRDPSAERLCALLGLSGDLVHPAAPSAGCLARGRLHRLPRGLVLGVPTDLDALAASGLVSPAGVARARRDEAEDWPLLTSAQLGLDDEDDSAVCDGLELSAGQILRSRLGDEVVDLVVDPLLGGINAGSVDRLSLSVVAPAVAAALAGQHSVVAPLRASFGESEEEAPAFFGVAGGLHRLVSSAEKELRSSGAEVLTSTPADAIAIRPDGRFTVSARKETLVADGIVLALPARRAARLLVGVAPAAARELAEIPYATVVTATYSYRGGDIEAPAGWSGFLVPRREGRLMTAVSLMSHKWPWMTPPGRAIVRVSAGRYGDERASQLEDAELTATLGGELAETLGTRGKPAACLVARFENAFPQYLPGHRARIRRLLRHLEAFPRLQVAGPLLGGVGIPSCITSGERAAERLVAELRR